MARASGLVLLVCAALALAGCGGDDGSASEDYASDVCSTLSTWVTGVQDAVQPLRDAGLSVSQDDIRTAVGDVQDSTETLVDDLEQLGPPETEDGEEAKTQLDSLASELTSQVDAVEQAVESGGGAAAIAATVGTAITTAANALQSTFDNLRGLDPAGELRDAFQDADDCDSLSDQIGDLRSGDGNR